VTAYRGACLASSFLTSALDKGELSYLRLRRFSPGTHWTLGGPHSRSWRFREDKHPLPLPGKYLH